MSPYHKFILIILLLFIHSLTFAQQPPYKKFIALSDIHFNPFIGCDDSPQPCPLLQELRTAPPESWNSVFQKHQDQIKTAYNQDTDYLLLASTFNELKTLSREQKPAFILLLGDFLAHQFSEKYQKYAENFSEADYQAFVKKTFQYLAYQFNQAAPTINVYFTLGNNDSYTEDYVVEPKGLLLKDIADIFSPLIHDKKNQKEFHRAFPNAGYYAVNLTKNQRLIVLNTVLFSAKCHDQPMRKAASEQLDWLQLQLANAKQQQQKVLLALHIPPGVDIYLDIKMRSAAIQYFQHPLFWRATYNKRFLSLMQSYSTTIAGILPGHIHSDAFQLIANPTLKTFIPVSFVPAISPDYGNNSGLKVFSYNSQTLQLVNFDTYFYPLAENGVEGWQHEYNFNTVYQPDCKQCSLTSGMLRLTKDNALAEQYKKYYAVGQDIQPITTQQAWIPYYWCGIYNMDWKSYKACL